MKTIAQQLNVKEFPFEIKDKDGNIIYNENSDGFWWRSEYKDGNRIYYENSDGDYENSDGEIVDNRPKETTEMTVEELEKLTGIKNLKIVK